MMAGALYLLGTVFGILGGITGGKVFATLISGKPLTGAGMLELAAAESAKLSAGAFFTFMMGISTALFISLKIIALTVILFICWSVAGGVMGV